jgi:hypothetical protein
MFDVARCSRHRAGARFTHSHERVVRVYLWSVLHDRPVSWACDPGNWNRPVRPPDPLPGQSTMSRRTRTDAFAAFLAALGDRLAGRPSAALLKYIDGKPVVVAAHSTDPDAAWGRGAGQKAKGYKLHAVWAADGAMPAAFEVRPLNVGEQQVAERLIPDALHAERPGYLLGDEQYNDSTLFDLAAARAHRLIAPRQQPGTGVGHHYQSPHRLRCIDMLEPGPAAAAAGHDCRFGLGLVRARRAIERRFGNAVSFGGGLGSSLPSFVRRLHRVRNWVHAKLLINAARIRRLAARRGA